MAAEDSSYCATHRDADRKHKREWRARQRRRRARNKECRDCGEKLGVGERIWCKEHRIARHRVSALRPAPGGVASGVEKSERVAAATRKHADGRTRFHGQQRRGQQTHAQLNKQDVVMADSCFDAFKAGIDLLGGEQAATWSRGERERVAKATANQGERTSRHIDDVLERLGHFKQRHGRRDGE